MEDDPLADEEDDGLEDKNSEDAQKHDEPKRKNKRRPKLGDLTGVENEVVETACVVCRIYAATIQAFPGADNRKQAARGAWETAFVWLELEEAGHTFTNSHSKIVSYGKLCGRTLRTFCRSWPAFRSCEGR